MSDNTRKYVLVLTACIDPSTGPAHVVRKSPLVRLEDYRRALNFWLTYPDPRLKQVIFIENSGYPLDSLKQTVLENNSLAKDIEFISLSCNAYPTDFHYGYAELAMLDEGLAVSRLAKSSLY